jgi:hypothetical protein
MHRRTLVIVIGALVLLVLGPIVLLMLGGLGPGDLPEATRASRATPERP